MTSTCVGKIGDTAQITAVMTFVCQFESRTLQAFGGERGLETPCTRTRHTLVT